MKIALAQINTKVGDLNGNTDKITDFTQRAVKQGADLAVFPELSITGYPPKDLLDFEAFIEDNIAQIEKLKEYSFKTAILCGFIDKNTAAAGKKHFNAAAFIHNGEIIAKCHKNLLPFYDVFDETRYFEPSNKPVIVNFKGKNIGLTICEDIWNDKDDLDRSLYKHNPITELVKNGADLILNISASPYTINKEKERFSVIGSIASKYSIPIVYVNQIGGNDDLLFDGSSFAVDKTGSIKVRCSDFIEDIAIYDTENNTGEIHKYSDSEEKSIFKALRIGLQDYCKKMKFPKVILGLSGGIDSAVTAAIAAFALGGSNVLGITLPSMYSSQGSIDDSKKLAQNLNIQFKEIPITNLFTSYIKNIQPEEGVLMDLAEENLQARIRANILMMYSNRYGHLLLSTGNKSEISVGYCTLYGDMSGGLNLLSDLPKTMVYRLARFINKDHEIIPESILTKPPSAELRPDQKDQDSLPPYEILDDILKMFIEENKMPSEIAQKYPAETVQKIIKKINNSEYKRKQATLGLKITTKAFGSGRRFPIVQGYDFKI